MSKRTSFGGGVRGLIGVIHLPPLPGSPRWAGDFDKVLRSALADARAFASGGADAVIIENFGDIPFTKQAVPAETVAAMAVAGSAIRAAISIPLGFNVLRNDGEAALALCAACGGAFVRFSLGFDAGSRLATAMFQTVRTANPATLMDPACVDLNN